MKKIVKSIFSNLWLKLLALVLALVIFYSVRDSLQRHSDKSALLPTTTQQERPNDNALPR